MKINNIPVRYVGQIVGGANYAPAFPGEHVEMFFTLDHAREHLRDLPMNDGASLALWAVDVHDSKDEAITRTRSDLAHASYLLEVGPRGGIATTRV